MQTKQHATKKKRGNQKIPKQMLMKTQPYEIYRMQQKQS